MRKRAEKRQLDRWKRCDKAGFFIWKWEQETECRGQNEKIFNILLTGHKCIFYYIRCNKRYKSIFCVERGSLWGKPARCFCRYRKYRGCLECQSRTAMNWWRNSMMSWRGWTRLSFPAKCRHNFSLRNFTVWKLRMKCWKQCIVMPAADKRINGKGN